MMKTKRYNDPVEGDDGYRVLVCRFRPRGVKRETEPWDVWVPELAPSAELLAAFHGKHGPAIAWGDYAPRYVEEMKRRKFWLEGFDERARKETITLLCSSACTDPARCHRTLLRGLMEEFLRKPAGEERKTHRITPIALGITTKRSAYAPPAPKATAFFTPSSARSTSTAAVRSPDRSRRAERRRRRRS